MTRSIVYLVCAIINCLFIFGCGGGANSAKISQNPQKSLFITPANNILRPGEITNLKVFSSEGSQPDITWSATGGQVDEIGLTYTAPVIPGLYSIHANLRNNPEIYCEFVVSIIGITVRKAGDLLDGPGWGIYFQASLLSDGRILINNQSSLGPLLWNPDTAICARAASCPIKPQFPTMVTMADGQLAQVAGGGLISNPNPRTIYTYDSAANSWAPLGRIFYLRYGQETATIMNDGRMLITGGETGDAGQNPTMEIWDPKIGGIATVVGYMQTPRSGHTSTLLPNGSVLLAGGLYGMASLSSCELVTPSLVGEAGPSMAVQRINHSATYLTNGKILMVGGGISPMLETFDPVSGKFNTVGTLDPAVIDHAAVVALPGGRAMIAGGQLGGLGQRTVSSIQIYAPEVGTTRNLADLPVPIYGAKAILGKNNMVYILGGLDSSSAGRTEVIEISIQ